jgi:hypothetical protein
VEPLRQVAPHDEDKDVRQAAAEALEEIERRVQEEGERQKK